MSKRTVFTELSVCETLIMRQIWAYEGDIPVQTLIVKLNEEYGKNYARTTVVTFLSKLKDKKFVETYRIGKMSFAKALRTEEDYMQISGLMESLQHYLHLFLRTESSLRKRQIRLRSLLRTHKYLIFAVHANAIDHIIFRSCEEHP